MVCGAVNGLGAVDTEQVQGGGAVWGGGGASESPESVTGTFSAFI